MSNTVIPGLKNFSTNRSSALSKLPFNNCLSMSPGLANHHAPYDNRTGTGTDGNLRIHNRAIAEYFSGLVFAINFPRFRRIHVYAGSFFCQGSAAVGSRYNLAPATETGS